jgi:Tfp pilus assembly protein PilV
MRLNRGQTIVEVVVAAGVMAVALTVLTSAVVSALANNREAKERAIATRLAQEVVEAFRFHRDNAGWGGFWDMVEDPGNSPYTVCVVMDADDLYNFNVFDDNFDTDYAEGDIDNLSGICTGFTQSNTTYFIGALVHADNTTTPFVVDLEVRAQWISGNNTREVSVSTQINQRL